MSAWADLYDFDNTDEGNSTIQKARETVLTEWSWRRVVRCFNLEHRTRSTGTIILRCLFHKEKTPSLTLSETSGQFKCYGCGNGGDLFKFLVLLLRPDDLDDLLFKLTYFSLSAIKGVSDIRGQQLFPFMLVS